MNLLFCSCVRKSDPIPDEVILELTIPKAQKAFTNGQFSIEDLTRAYIERINRIDCSGPNLQSVICINPEAIEIARKLDRELRDGKTRGPLHGIPILLKDNIDTHDKMPTTAGSVIMRNSFPLTDSWLVEKLRKEGAVILGKTNLSEWANFHSSIASHGWSPIGGQTRNPYDTAFSPSGSSAGSAVAVSANLCLAAIGTETNGSIVSPASRNGIVGIKPTLGLISRSGIIPIAKSLDTPGPMTRTVMDAAIILGCLTGVDPEDSATLASSNIFLTNYTTCLKPGQLNGKKLGIYHPQEGLYPKVDSVFNLAKKYLLQQGATLVKVPEILKNDSWRLSLIVMLYEFHQGIDNYLQELGPNRPANNLDELVKLTLADSAEMQYFDHKLMQRALNPKFNDTQKYLNALSAIRNDSRQTGIDSILQCYQLDAIIAPTAGPSTPIEMEKSEKGNFSTNSPAALAGYPNITVPMGFVDGLPIGLSFFGPAWSEPLLLGLAFSYEQGTLHRTAPSLTN